MSSKIEAVKHLDAIVLPNSINDAMFPTDGIEPLFILSHVKSCDIAQLNVVFGM